MMKNKIDWHTVRLIASIGVFAFWIYLMMFADMDSTRARDMAIGWLVCFALERLS